MSKIGFILLSIWVVFAGALFLTGVPIICAAGGAAVSTILLYGLVKAEESDRGF